MRFALALLFLASGAHAQDAAIRVETSTPEALVAVDGTVLGAASGTYAVASGERAIALVEPTAGWDGRRAEAAVQVASGDTLVVALELPVRTRIESIPLHATVTLVRADGSREALGTTPLVIDRPDGLDGAIVATLDGYADATADAPVAGGRVSLMLRPEDLAEGEVPLHVLPTERRNPTRTLIDVGLGAAAIAAGAVAVHYKFQADAADEQYRDFDGQFRGVESLRQDALRYDTLSGIALGVSSASLGFLAIRLAIR